MDKYNHEERSEISQDTPDHVDEECHVLEYSGKEQEFDESLHDDDHVEHFDGNLHANR